MRKLLTALAGLLTMLLLVPTSALAQDGTIEGMVTDAETEEPLPGVNVIISELQVGAATTGEGTYAITGVPPGDYTLTATFVGYEDFEQEVSVTEGETVTLDIALAPSVAELAELVVEGYRIVQEAEPTGASAEVSGEIIEEANVQTATEAIQGRAAGVRITSTSGQPGSAFEIQVRGQGSITAGTDPLYVVDGVQINTESNSNEANLSPLAAIDPNDIESIRVLKDASATAIYGARAANGVVLITTKSGVAGETRVNFTAQTGAVMALKEFDILSAPQWAAYIYEEAENAGVSREAIAEQFAIPSTNPDELVGTDWYDAAHRTGYTQGYDLSVSGGSEDTRFRISGTYEVDKGQVIKSGLNQVGLRVNLDHDISDAFTVGTKLNLSTLELRGSISDGPFINSPFWASYLIPPHHSIYNEPGNPESGYNNWSGTFSYNVVQQEDFNTQRTNSNQLIGSVNATWRIAPWLVARSLVGVSHEDLAEKDRRDPRLPQNASVGGSAFVSSTRETTFNASQTFNYNFALSDMNSISGLVGTEFRREYYQFSGAGGQGFPFFLFQNLQNTAEPTSATEFDTESRILSFFGDAEYGFDERYIVRGTLRYDGSSRFGSENRFGLFGSAGLAWNISNEAFMDDVDFVNNLKLRGSYGVLGNSDFGSTIGNFAARRLYGGGGEYIGQPGLQPSSLGNQALTWEASAQSNIGLDYVLFDSRVSGSFNVYRTNTSELLLQRDLPLDSGFGSVLENVGVIRNEGIEFAISTVNVSAGGFQWNTDFNITFQRSEVLDLVGDDEEIINDTQPGGDLYRVGEPLGLYERVPWAGINPADGRPLYLDENGNLTYTVGGADAQRTFGNVLADFYGGLANTISFKGVTMDVLFQYDYGRKTFNNDRYFIDGAFPFNHTTSVLDHWEEPGDVASRPLPWLNGLRPGSTPYSGGYFNSSVFMEDASYIRLKQLRLSYELPASLLAPIGMQRASIFAQGTNLLTFTNYTGIDPEQVGTALGQYPQNRRYTAGISVTL